MELLDLTRHDPEEYEGKTVMWRECEYTVGCYLGTGMERITHELVNRASGLALHVLKVWRKGSLGYVPSEMRAKLAAGSTPEFNFAELIPVSIEIELPGGLAEIQIFVGTSSRTPTEADTLTRKGDELFDQSRFQEAMEAYQQALTRNPQHTHALANLGAGYAQRNDPTAAYRAVAEARSIEPNYPMYHRACIQYLAAQGLARLALNEFQSSRAYFPNVYDFHDLGAQLLMVCGYPEESVPCAEECVLRGEQKAALVQKCRDAVEAKAKAAGLIDQARSLLQAEKRDRIVELLRAAREIDANDPVLGINLGLSLARVGRPGEALPLLLQGTTYGPHEWTKVCYANAAFCAMEVGKLDGARILLEATMSQLELELNGQEMQNPAVDLPGRGIWIDGETIMEERIDTASELVSRCVRGYAGSEEALRLAALYARAVEP